MTHTHLQSTHTYLQLQGLWLPLITPFANGRLDETSLRRLVKHYLTQPVDGFIMAATTGEGLTLDERETEKLVRITADEVAQSGQAIPVYLGVSGSYTDRVVRYIKNTTYWPIDGYLISCPYYTKPSQTGLVQHFTALAASTNRPIVIYNIPYRTGVNLANEAMLQLAELQNIIGVKDCCAIPEQSFELMQNKPVGFQVMTGEDAFLYRALTNGADGGILASAHILTGTIANIRNKLAAGDLVGAKADWAALEHLPELLFAEPSPSPIKHWLWRAGLIESPEVRLPMVPVSADLAKCIDEEMKRHST
ncbi:MAG: 4-hydroxy-tetrahydrodipicolinate synthase [Cohaesibacteraceae bacterium]|nr:4-hydroxy-tetrahydrodipicolinate synthase [Cohaesibacteraceae bacterium]MBL4875289.1 4-hydroxy-tetrahydrodipicolinate synthase [Cohaesibacteraceae bacterium]